MSETSVLWMPPERGHQFHQIRDFAITHENLDYPRRDYPQKPRLPQFNLHPPPFTSQSSPNLSADSQQRVINAEPCMQKWQTIRSRLNVESNRSSGIGTILSLSLIRAAANSWSLQCQLFKAMAESIIHKSFVAWAARYVPFSISSKVLAIQLPVV